MTVQVEFFFDLSSPWTYLAFHGIQPIIAETGAAITWRPMLLGGVFNAVNDSVYQMRDNAAGPKYRLTEKWMNEWARQCGLPLNFPSVHHPLRSVAAMRLCCLLEERQETLFRFAGHAFHAYCVDQRNLDDPGVLAAVADECGLPGAELVARTSDEATKAKLRDNTTEAVARGAYGSPTIFVDHDHLYFGNDQLPIVRQRIITRQAV